MGIAGSLVGMYFASREFRRNAGMLAGTCRIPSTGSVTASCNWYTRGKSYQRNWKPEFSHVLFKGDDGSSIPKCHYTGPLGFQSEASCKEWIDSHYGSSVACQYDSSVGGDCMEALYGANAWVKGVIIICFSLF